MKLVKESLEFQEPNDGNSYKKMKIGEYRPKTKKVPLEYEELSAFGRKMIGMSPIDHGSFGDALIKAFQLASAGNRRPLIDGFPNFFNEYDLTQDYNKMVLE